MNTTSRKILLALLALIVGSGLVAALVLTVGHVQKTSTPRYKAAETLRQSPILGGVKQLAPKLSTLMSATTPATPGWWDFIARFTPQWQLPSFTALPDRPTSLGVVVFANSAAQAKQFPDYFGNPTIYLKVGSETVARRTVAAITRLADEHNQNYQAFSSGSLVVVLPTSLYSDELFAKVKKHITEPKAGAEVTTGAWQVNWHAIDNYFATVTGRASKNYKVYQEALTALGYNAAANGSWYGTSMDRVHWQGGNSGTGTVWQPGDYTRFQKVLSATATVTRTDGKTTGLPSKADDPNYIGRSTYHPNQALMLEYLTYATNKDAHGTLTDPASGAVIKAKRIKPAGITRYTVNPNAWYGIMTNPAQTGYYKTFNTKSMHWDLHDDRMDLTLVY